MHCNDNLQKPLKKPKISNVRSVDPSGNVTSILGQTLTKRVPQYLVDCPQGYPAFVSYNPGHDLQIKLIGFGERFLAGRMPKAIFPFNFQAPELLLDSQLGPSADIWSLGCTVSLHRSPYLGSTKRVSRSITSLSESPYTRSGGTKKPTWSTNGSIPSEIRPKSGSIISSQNQMSVSE